jgi:hypothetical protein
MKSLPNSGIEQLKSFIRSPYAWAGGYPLYAVMGDGEPLCKVCAPKEYKRIVRDTMEGFDRSFQVIGVDVNYEDSEMYCCHCNEKIESAYAD